MSEVKADYGPWKRPLWGGDHKRHYTFRHERKGGPLSRLRKNRIQEKRDRPWLASSERGQGEGKFSKKGGGKLM